MHLNRIEMQLPQYIIDLVGSLYDEGQEDEDICDIVLQELLGEKDRVFPARLAEISPGKIT